MLTKVFYSNTNSGLQANFNTADEKIINKYY